MILSERRIGDESDGQDRYFISSVNQNLRSLRRRACRFSKHEKTAKGGIKAKRLQCVWNEDYLLNVLAG